MKANEFVNEMRRLGLGAFRSVDAVKLLEGSNAYANLFLHRLARRHQIENISRGIYALKGVSKLEIANLLEPRGYVSNLAALFRYGLINQDPLVVDIISSRRSFSKEISYDKSVINIKAIKISRKRFFGFRKEKGYVGYFLIAEPEKAILDTLYLYKKGLASYCKEAFENGSGMVLEERLVKYARRMGSEALLDILEKDVGVNARADTDVKRLRA
jgi:predicted transcriptional regulator of viral defense system